MVKYDPGFGGVKRFLQAFSWPLVWISRPILLEPILWCFQISQLEIILLDIDLMGMDNNEADKREGVGYGYIWPFAIYDRCFAVTGLSPPTFRI